MKEKPIIFNTEMVRANLDRRKSQTRRPIKGLDASQWEKSLLEAGRWQEAIKCPWQIGDRLWVRETWCLDYEEEPVYKVDVDRLIEFKMIPSDIYKWRPSIHMPRWASRILLEITNIRVERLQEIQGHDLIEEGIGCGGLADDFAEDILRFRKFWDSCNSNFNLWHFNPWVWVLEFKRIK